MNPRAVAGAALAGFPLFARLDLARQAEVAAACHRRTVAAGGYAFRAGDDCHGLYCVRSGLVTLSLTLASGAEKVIEIVTDGEQFAEAVVFSDGPYPVDARAVLDSELLVCPAAVVHDLVERDPAFARSMLAGLSARLHQLLADVESYALRTATQRVVAWLLSQCPPGRSRDEPYTVRLSTTKAVLASRLGVAPETFSRTLRLLVDDGVVSAAGRTLTVNGLADLRAHLP